MFFFLHRPVFAQRSIVLINSENCFTGGVLGNEIIRLGGVGVMAKLPSVKRKAVPLSAFRVHTFG